MELIKAGRCALPLLLAGCISPPTENSNIPISDLHIDPAKVSAEAEANIPDLAPLDLPRPTLEQRELYSVVVSGVPVEKLLFALARDAGRNVDIHPEVQGNVTLNAIDQTLEQILKRVQKQVDIRFRVEGNLIVVEPDAPYLYSYDVNYLNISRQAVSEVSIATEVSSTGGAATEGASGEPNVSNTRIFNESSNDFWNTLLDNIRAILRGGDSAIYSLEDANNDEGAELANSIIANRESGTVTIRATQRQHQEVSDYIARVIERSQRQVIIEATIAEVTLNDDYQAGVDWTRLAEPGTTGFSFTQNLLGGNLSTAPFFNLTYNNVSGTDWSSTVRLLDQFGNTKVLSSPKLMVLNNQTAVLKVVENRVYFTTTVEREEGDGNAEDTIIVESTVNTVPVGFVMSVTPQIGDDGEITLNARPTISRITGFVEDPGPSIASALASVNNPIPIVQNLVPEIQVREIESMLKVSSGSVAVIGGLMQDTLDDANDGVPGLSRVPVFGRLFKYQNTGRRKTELVIFIRPVVVDSVSDRQDLAQYGHLVEPQASKLQLLPPRSN